MEPGKPPVKITGTETVRAFGDAWIVSEGKAQTPDGQHIIMLGYNPQKRRFVGTFVDSGTPHLWVYDGSLAGDTLTLESEGPSMADDGTMATYRDVIEIVSDDHWVLRSLMPGDNGSWQEFMAMHNYRKK